MNFDKLLAHYSFSTMNVLLKFVALKKIKIVNFRSFTRLSYYHKIGKTPLQYVTFGNAIRECALKYEDKTAIISVEDNRKITFSQIFQECDKLAAGFHKIGLKVGDKIGIWTPNIAEWATIMMACERAGLVMVTLNSNYTHTELDYYINKVQMKAIVCLESYKQFEFYNTLSQLIPNLQTSDRNKLHSKKVPTLEYIITISSNSLGGTYNYQDLLDYADEQSIDRIKKLQNYIQPDDVACILFSSGTTGKAKGTCLSHFQILNHARILGKRILLDKDEHINCVQLPLHYMWSVVGNLSTSLWYGTTIVIPSMNYNSKKILKALENYRCTITTGTPTMFIDMISNQKEENRQLHLKRVLCGGASLSPQLIENMRKTLALENITLMYGLTEACPVISISQPFGENTDQTYYTVGQVLDHMEAKVVDDNDNIVPMGTPGEMCARGYSIMLGYCNDEEKTKEAIKFGWLKTGDKVTLDENGYVKVIGRIKDMIIRGGENIFPIEIEDLLSGHPDILECCVIGLSHERLGEEVCVCARVKPGSDLTIDSVKEFCKGKLARFKIPSQLRILESFPKNQTGKIMKYVLKEQLDSK